MKRNKRKGFTLIELLIVLGLIALLMLIAVPNYLKIKRDAKLKVAEIEEKQENFKYKDLQGNVITANRENTINKILEHKFKIDIQGNGTTAGGGNNSNSNGNSNGNSNSDNIKPTLPPAPPTTEEGGSEGVIKPTQPPAPPPPNPTPQPPTTEEEEQQQGGVINKIEYLNITNEDIREYLSNNAHGTYFFISIASRVDNKSKGYIDAIANITDIDAGQQSTKSYRLHIMRGDIIVRYEEK